MTAEPAPEINAITWPVPPPDGYTVDDLLTLPDLPPHTELIDGSLVFVSPQRNFHADVDGPSGQRASGVRPRDRLRVKRRDDRRSEQAVTVRSRTSRSSGPSRSTARTRPGIRPPTSCSPSRSSRPTPRERDRDTKPRKYAAAGIPHFWLVERAGENPHPVVRVYELDPVAKGYTLRGNFHGRLTLDEPFDIDIDLTAVDEL